MASLQAGEVCVFERDRDRPWNVMESIATVLEQDSTALYEQRLTKNDKDVQQSHWHLLDLISHHLTSTYIL